MPTDLAVWSLGISVLSLALGGGALVWNVYSWRKDRRPAVQVDIWLQRAGELAGRDDWAVPGPTNWDVTVTVALRNSYPVYVEEARVVAPLRRTDPVTIQRTLRPGDPPAVARFPLDQVGAHGIDVYKPFQGYVVLGAPFRAALSRQLKVHPWRPSTMKEEFVEMFESRSTDYVMMPRDFPASPVASLEPADSDGDGSD